MNDMSNCTLTDCDLLRDNSDDDSLTALLWSRSSVTNTPWTVLLVTQKLYRC